MELEALRESIAEVNSQILEAERLILQTDREDYRDILTINLRSLKEERDRFEDEWEQCAKSVGKDVCVYRIEPQHGGGPDLAAVAEMLSAFQLSVTEIYAGLTNGPSERRRTNTKLRKATAFEIGFVSPGSLIVTLTLKEQQLEIFDDNEFDDDYVTVRNAIDNLYEITTASTMKDMSRFADVLGRPAVRSVKSWLDTHARHNANVFVMWNDSDKDTSRRIQLDSYELIDLREIIDSATESQISYRQEFGRLQAWDADKRTFKLLRDDDDLDLIVGKVSQDVDMDSVVPVRETYLIDLKVIQYPPQAAREWRENFVLQGLQLWRDDG